MYFNQVSNYNLEDYKKAIKLSVLSHKKASLLINILEMVKNVDGDMAELGVYRGGSAYLIHKKYPTRILHLFDSFDGMKEPIQSNEYHKQGDFDDTSLEFVAANLNYSKYVYFHKGWFPESIPEHMYDKKYSFVHLDGDFYESTLDAINYFYPRMSKNGIIVLDDYVSNNTPNVKRAILELKEKYNYKFYVTDLEQAVIKKLY